MIHQKTHPNLDVEDCYGCRISGIMWGTVPGGTRPGGKAKVYLQRKEKGMTRYAEKRRAGEQPDGLTLEKQEATDRRIDTFQKMERELREDNAPEVVNDFERRVKNARK